MFIIILPIYTFYFFWGGSRDMIHIFISTRYKLFNSQFSINKSINKNYMLYIHIYINMKILNSTDSDIRADDGLPL